MITGEFIMPPTAVSKLAVRLQSWGLSHINHHGTLTSGGAKLIKPYSFGQSPNHLLVDKNHSVLWYREAMVNLQRVGNRSINSLWPNDVRWGHRTGSTLVHVMAWCLMAPSHNLHQAITWTNVDLSSVVFNLLCVNSRFLEIELQMESWLFSPQPC